MPKTSITHTEYYGGARLPNPIRQLLLSPLLPVSLCIVVAVLLFPVSLHLSLAAVSFSYVFLSYYIERKNVDFLIIPPLAILALYNLFSGSLGPVLLAGNLFSKEIDSLLIAHISYVVTFPLLLAIYWLVNSKNPPVLIPEGEGILSIVDNKQLRLIAFSLIVFTVCFHYVQISTGVEDRGYAGDIVLENPYGIWSYFIAFGQLQYVAYMLIPYAYRNSNWVFRALLTGLLSFYLLFQVANSSRGGIFFPFIFIVIGYWMIGGNFRRTVLTSLSLGVFMFIITPIFGEFRSSGALQDTALINVSDRIARFIELQKSNAEFSAGRDNASRVMGAALLGCSDPIIYEYTPSLYPFAGWERFSGILYAWLPSTFFPDKPQLNDGNMISSQYTGVYNERSGIGIKLQADLYRRFGWLGVFVGYPFFALLISLFARYGFRSFSNSKTRVWGFIVILFITTFLCANPFGTVLGMIWGALYYYPKYLIALALLVFASKTAAKFNMRIGHRFGFKYKGV